MTGNRAPVDQGSGSAVTLVAKHGLLGGGGGLGVALPVLLIVSAAAAVWLAAQRRSRPVS
jgi:hypothetical protein